MFADVRVHSAEGIVQDVDVAVRVDGSSQADTLLLTPAKIDALRGYGLG